MRKLNTKALALIAALMLVLAACGGDDTSSSEEEETAATEAATEATEAATEDTEAATEETAAAEDMGEPLTVAIVAPSAANDLAFTQSIVDAVNRLEGIDPDVAISENMFVVEDAADTLRGYAEDGYDLVIGHGSQYGALLAEIAPDFPDTAFAWGTAADTYGLDNVSAYEAASDEGGYVMGVMAAALSEAGSIGVVGPIETGDAALYVDGFIAGAQAENPDVVVTPNYIGSFSDVALASEAAEAFVSAGADVMTGTAQMTVGAIGVAADNGIPWFGTQSNQTSVAPDIVVASQVYHWEVVLQGMVDSIRAGDLGGEIYSIDLANGGLVIEYNDGFDLAADIKAKGDEAAAAIADGSLDTGV